MEARLTQEFTDGKVSLVWCTPNAEELIVRMARVSAPANENNMDCLLYTSPSPRD